MFDLVHIFFQKALTDSMAALLRSSNNKALSKLLYNGFSIIYSANDH